MTARTKVFCFVLFFLFSALMSTYTPVFKIAAEVPCIISKHGNVVQQKRPFFQLTYFLRVRQPLPGAPSVETLRTY